MRAVHYHHDERKTYNERDLRYCLYNTEDNGHYNTYEYRRPVLT